MGTLTGEYRKRANPGPVKGSRVTKTDAEVIHRIATKGFQTYQELRRGILQNYTREHSWSFMKKLVRLGYLVQARSDEGGILGWSLSKKTRKTLLESGSFNTVRDANPPRYRTSFSHDVIVREIEDLLLQSSLVTDWVPEHVLRREVMSKIQYLNVTEKSEKLAKVPDARFNLELSGTHYLAVLELELARKTRKRVYDRIEAHVVNEDIDFVFFVVSHANHLRFLWEVYEEVLSQSYRVKLAKSQNGIFFSTLKNLRKHGLRANFRGIDENFSFDPKRK